LTDSIEHQRGLPIQQPAELRNAPPRWRRSPRWDQTMCAGIERMQRNAEDGPASASMQRQAGGRAERALCRSVRSRRRHFRRKRWRDCAAICAQFPGPVESSAAFAEINRRLPGLCARGWRTYGVRRWRSHAAVRECRWWPAGIHLARCCNKAGHLATRPAPGLTSDAFRPPWVPLHRPGPGMKHRMF
jgi:hypothetical protein